jgi:UDP-N-acetylmuramoyl-tripeptide--D-alanyl-D-alanine ligase
MTLDRFEEARMHRQQLRNVVVVAVTGSCGKTTTKDLIFSVLGSRLTGSKNDDTRNCGEHVVDALLRVRPEDEFFVQELGAWGPGTLDAGIDLVRPDIAVITNLRNDHFSSLRGPRGAQTEKGKLVKAVPATGGCVLNWDDPLVRELASWTDAPTLSFGRSSDADLSAVEVTARWPERLAFTVRWDAVAAHVHTQLLGEHLLSSALAALGVGLFFGLGLEEAAAALAEAEPSFRRMSCVTDPEGVTFIRDDWKAPLDSVVEALAFMANARAPRKLAVLGTISDFPGRSRRTYCRVAWEALAVLDAVVFVGERAVELWGEHRGEGLEAQKAIRSKVLEALDDGAAARSPDAERPGDMFVFETVRDANTFLCEYLRAGDLVLVKASGPADHIERVIHGRRGSVTCWEAHCGRLYPCDLCDLLSAPVDARATTGAMSS